jgi:hypothetical protein
MGYIHIASPACKKKEMKRSAKKEKKDERRARHGCE